MITTPSYYRNKLRRKCTSLTTRSHGRRIQADKVRATKMVEQRNRGIGSCTASTYRHTPPVTEPQTEYTKNLIVTRYPTNSYLILYVLADIRF